MTLLAKIIIEDSFDSVIEYECPKCQDIHELEADAGIITCTCGVKLMCDIMYCI